MPYRYWLSFDVGLSSSFERLYSWLDDHGARECSENVATVLHQKSFNAVADEIIAEVQKDNGRGTRLYLIGPTAKGHIGGRFLSGKRKASPWEGFGASTPEGESDEG